MRNTDNSPQPIAIGSGGMSHFHQQFGMQLKTAHANNMYRKYLEAFASSYILVCMPADLAVFSLADSILLLKEAGLYHKGVKHYARRAKVITDKYSLTLQKYLDCEGSFQYYMDMSDAFMDRIRPHMLNLRMSIKNALDKYNEPLSEVKSHVLLTVTLFDIAVHQFDDFWEWKRSQGVVGIHDAAWMRLAGASSAWRSAEQQIPYSTKEDIGREPNVELGIKALCNAIRSTDTINAAGFEALELNPDRSETTGLEDRNRVLKQLQGAG